MRIIYTLTLAALLPLGQLHAQPGNPPEPPGMPGQTNSEGGWGKMTPEERFQHFSDKLGLTEDQKPKVQAIFEDWHAKMQDAKTNAEAQLQEVLTPEQYQKFESMRQHKGHWHHGGDTDQDGESATNSPSGQ